MREFCPHRSPLPMGEGVNKSPARRRRAGLEVSLLCLTDFQDFNIICAAWSFHFYSIACFVIENGFTDG